MGTLEVAGYLARYAERVQVTIDAMQKADLADVLAIDSGATPAQLEEELTRPWALTRVARDAEGHAVGLVLAWLVADETHLLNIAVRSDARRRGIGRALLLDLLAASRERAIKQVLLEVRAGNEPAIALYRSLGFVPQRVRKRYYPDDEDAVEMTLALGPS